MAALEAVLETAGRVALPALRDVSESMRQRYGWGTATLAKTSAKVDRLAELWASGYEEQTIRFGILDHPSTLFTAGTILPDIPQTEEVLEFRKEDLSSECMSGIYEEISRNRQNLWWRMGRGYILRLRCGRKMG